MLCFLDKERPASRFMSYVMPLHDICFTGGINAGITQYSVCIAWTSGPFDQDSATKLLFLLNILIKSQSRFLQK